jgi:formate dehydrogenase maturation protein FdhE
MNYRIPPAKILVEAISEVIREKQSVDSQRMLTELVQKALKKRDTEYTASEVRIRKAAVLKTPLKLHIHYRETNETSTKGRCPVCGSETKQIRNKTLFDEKVDLGFRCTKCPYWTGQLKRVPVRYIFNALIEEVPKPPRRKGDGKYSQWKFA